MRAPRRSHSAMRQGGSTLGRLWSDLAMAWVGPGSDLGRTWVGPASGFGRTGSGRRSGPGVRPELRNRPGQPPGRRKQKF
eukprot:391445-Pyramimonas_sp.AAC.2